MRSLREARPGTRPYPQQLTFTAPHPVISPETSCLLACLHACLPTCLPTATHSISSLRSLASVLSYLEGPTTSVCPGSIPPPLPTRPNPPSTNILTLSRSADIALGLFLAAEASTFKAARLVEGSAHTGRSTGIPRPRCSGIVNRKPVKIFPTKSCVVYRMRVGGRTKGRERWGAGGGGDPSRD